MNKILSSNNKSEVPEFNQSILLTSLFTQMLKSHHMHIHFQLQSSKGTT